MSGGCPIAILSLLSREFIKEDQRWLSADHAWVYLPSYLIGSVRRCRICGERQTSTGTDGAGYVVWTEIEDE